MGDFKIPIKISILLVSVLLSGSTVQAQSSVIDKSDPPLQVLSSSYSRPDSTGYANNTIELTINSAFPVSVTIDGTMQGSDVSNFELSAGQHTFSVPEIVQLRAGTRLKFQKWTDGVTAPNRTEYLTGDATFTAIYVLQYSLVLVSPEANVTGTGWYDEGTSASLSAPPTAPMGGMLGLIGAKWIFQGWYEEGALVSSSNQFFLPMTKPHRYHAIWTADYTLAGLVSGVGLTAILFGTYVYRRRTGRR